MVCAFRSLDVSKGFLFLLAFLSLLSGVFKIASYTNSTRDFLADFFQCRACAVELFNGGRRRICLVEFFLTFIGCCVSILVRLFGAILKQLWGS